MAAAQPGAGFLAQAGAVLRSNASLQRRSLLTNACLLVLPLAFCALLFGLQLAVNSALDSRQYHCGCRCTQCCDWAAPQPGSAQGAAYECYTATPERPCSPYAACSAYDDSDCGFQHSSYQQAAFCPVKEPPTWPALLQVPLAKYRNGQLQDDAALQGNSGGGAGATLAPQPPLLLPYSGQDRQQAARLMGQLLARQANLSTQLLATLLRSPLLASQLGSRQAGPAGLDLCAPDVTRASLQQLLANATGNSTVGGAGGGSSTGSDGGGAGLGQASRQLSQLLSDLGVVLGTAAPTSPTNYLEPAFVAGSAAFDTQSSSGAGSLAGSGSQARAVREAAGRELRPLYYVADDCSALAPADARVVAQLGCALDKLLGVPLRCASTQPQWEPDQQGLQQEIFCGWQAAACVAALDGQAGAVQEVRLPAYQVDAAIRQWPSLLYDWRDTGNTSFDVVISVNHTYTSPATNLAPQLQRWAAPVNLATNAYLREQMGGASPWSIRLAGLKGFPFRGGRLRLDFAALLGPLFFMWLLQLPLPLFAGQLVAAKEQGSRQMMALQGLGDGPYLAATWLWQMGLYCAFLAVLLAGGWVLGLKAFTLNDLGVQLVFYLLWGHLQTTWAYYISSVMASAQAAVIWAVSIAIFSGLIANLVMVQFVQFGPAWLALVLQLLPSFGLYRGLWELSQYAFLADSNGGTGLTWAKLRDPGNDMLLLWAIFVAESVWITFCAWYVEQVFGAGSTGVRRHPFFLMGFKYAGDGESKGRKAGTGLLAGWLAGKEPPPSAATADELEPAQGPAGGAVGLQQAARAMPEPGMVQVAIAVEPAAAPKPGQDGGCEITAAPPLVASSTVEVAATQPAAGDCADVAAEEARAAAAWRAQQQDPAAYERAWDAQQQERQRQEGEGGAGSAAAPGGAGAVPALLAHKLFKSYPGQDGAPPKHAVRGLSLVVAPCECFGLLGPNGAGKTSSLRLMQGLLSPSSGSVLVAGRDLAADPAAARRLVGVCPQHDVLWDGLTGREHLLLYCRLRGLTGSELADAVGASLAEVGLADVANKVSGAYSGGMRRRLSCAIAMTGRPAVVFLDEPSTGLDPGSRRMLWQVARRAAQRHALVLTTHSLEEAEALCGRIGIFVAGQLRCVGTPQELTARYGGCLTLSLTTPPAQEALAQAAVAAMCPTARPSYCLSGTQTFELPVCDIGLAQVFARMQALEGAAGECDEEQGEGRGGEEVLRVLNWGVSSATLEQVFLKVVAQAAVAESFI